MSTATAASARTAPSTRPTSLSVVPRPRPKAARGAFVLLIVALLVGGLMTLLALNTALAQDAFVVQNLQQQHNQLDVFNPRYYNIEWMTLLNDMEETLKRIGGVF